MATNYHVIKDASSASVRFRDGTEAEVAGYRSLDTKHDLAILQLTNPPRTMEVLKINVPAGLKQGEAIIAIGHPGGFEFTVSRQSSGSRFTESDHSRGCSIHVKGNHL